MRALWFNLKLESDTLIAEVISLEQRLDRHRLILDKGERDGVRGAVMIDSTGHRAITQVMPGLSKVTLVTDHAVPLLNERTGQVIAEGLVTHIS